MMDENDSPNAPFQPQTLVELLRTRASQLLDSQAFLYLVDGEEEDATLTFAQIDQRARSLAAWLQQEGVAGGRALLLYPPGLDFITAFFGCLYAGVVAVPVYPPRLNRPSPRIQTIVADAQVTVALTTTKIYRGLERRFNMMPELAALRWLNSEDWQPDDQSSLWQDPGITSDHLAFLQYTSGSTGSPKGVMLSHANLLHNLEVIRHGFQLENGTTSAFWLPSYHDMGLIGGILSPLFVGGRAVLMAPAAFLQRPVRWLEAISRYQTRISGAPNFAYQMCVDKISPEQREGLDLNCWKVAFCGAEPIRLETLDNFVDTFAPHGFRRESFYPCYGLAENTLMVSGGDVPSGPLVSNFHASALSENLAIPSSLEAEDRITLVSCGHTILDQQIVIANPSTLVACKPGEIGEIWTTGPSVAQGYWKRPELTEQVFDAHLAGSEKGRFLRTGDLGFVHEGELYITGRLKDLIIIRGRNHYPQDIEHTAGQCHEALEAGMSAAFSVMEDGEEKLVLVHEVTRRHRKPDLESVVTAVRRAVAQEHQLQLHAIVLIRPLSVPRTSSGKIKRHACKQGYLDGSLRVVGAWQAGQRSTTRHSPPATKPVLSPSAGSAQAPSKDYQSLPEQFGKLSTSSAGGAPATQSASELANWMVGHIATQLHISAEQIDIHTPFVDYGLDSVQAVSIAGEIETRLGRSLSPTLLWDYPTIAALSVHLAEEPQEQLLLSSGKAAMGVRGAVGLTTSPRGRSSDEVPKTSAIAVIGLSCRFPGAAGPEDFWRLLQQGVDAVQEVPAERWDLESFYDDGRDPPPGKMNTRWGGFLAQVDHFDAAFFGVSPREAARLDPQQRLLLEVTWEALERAGQNPTHLAGSATGVFVGISSSDYSWLQFSDPALIDAYAGTGNAHSIAANRLSYFLDLRGPSMAIDTACSSSLVATHLGMNSLRSGEVDLALVGGVNVLLSPDLTISFSQARMMAPNGRCKTFDARADGYVRSEGCGIVVLKRLTDAQRDGDPILAVLRGSAVNQDGRSNGLTAPNGPAQQAVIRQAQANAGVTPADISYIEAHGTGTRLGDPIEVQALQAVLDDGEAQGDVFAGSVKTNIGHLEAAAGVAGLIKTILALTHGEIPPHLHFQELNPHISLDNSRLVIDRDSHNWRRGEVPRLAGVSSFGFGGTNAHVIVQEAPFAMSSGREPATDEQAHLLTLSAKDEKVLGQLTARFAVTLEENPALALADVCYTANTGRALFPQRLAVVADSTEELRQKLSAFKPSLVTHPLPLKIAFLFTGQGAQYVGMGRQLYETEPVFRTALERCAAILTDIEAVMVAEVCRGLRQFVGTSPEPACEPALLDVIYPGEESTGNGNQTIDETTYTQPALFAVGYALAELWRSWGVEPDVVMGHSVGEFIAACVAGVMSLEDGLRLVAARGRLMGALPSGGGMAAIFATEAEVKKALSNYQRSADELPKTSANLGGRVSIAGNNGPNNIAISGDEAAVTAVVEQLAEEGIEYRYLTVSHAFHSPLMDPMLDAFEAAAGEVTFHAPRIPLVSNVTGQLLRDAPDAGYWRRHAREAVQFTRGMETLAETGATIFLEIGPQPHLTGMGRRCLAADARAAKVPKTSAEEAIWLYSLKKGRNDRRLMLDSLGKMVMAGVDVDWAGFYGQAVGRKVVLPTYPFQRERHWLEARVALRQTQDRLSEWPFGGLKTGLLSGTRISPDEGVRRLPVPVPLFEATLVLSDPQQNKALLREMVLAVADLFWGPGTHQVEGIAVDERFEAASDEWSPEDLGRIAEDLGQSADEVPQTSSNLGIVTQTTVNASGEDAAFFQIFVHDGEEGSWKLLAGGQMRRGVEGRRGSDDVGTFRETPAVVTRQALLAASAERRPEIARSYLQERVAAVLGLEVTRLSLEQPLDTLGMDSLMALELKNGIELDLEIDLPLVNLLQGPTIAELAQQLLAHLAKPRAAAVIQAIATPAEAAPLTYDQQAMWLLQQLMPPDTSFNVAGAARVVGDLDIAALRRALQQLVQRHVSLRTIFSLENGRPVQIVQDTAEGILVEIEAAGWDEAALHSFLQQEAHHPFNLEEGPLLRLVILKRTVAEGYQGLPSSSAVRRQFDGTLQEAVLLLSLSHLITDFWSMSLLVQELSLLYTAERTGQAAALAPIELLPADYAHWQADMLAGPEGEALRQYWLQKLAGDLPRLDLPTDRPRTAVLTFDGDTVSRLYDKTVSSGLKALSQAHGATLATTLLAAFQTLLHRLTGQEELLVGSVIAGRERPELQNIVGYFVNPVALRADFSHSPTFVEFLAQVRQTIFEAIEHQEYPLPRLAEDLAAANKQPLDPSRPPLFETMFIMQRAQVMADEGLSAFALGIPGTRIELDGGGQGADEVPTECRKPRQTSANLGPGGLTIEPVPLRGQPAQFDLTLMMAEVDDELAATLHYNTQLFDRATADRLLQQLESMLHGITETEGRGPVASLPLLAVGEREKLILSWNATQIAYESDKTVHQLVGEQAARTPDKIAVTFDGMHLSYAELERRANWLAIYLQGLGVGPETLVGLFVERSLDMMIGLLGILKAGGAYIPLDPDFPPSRISLMLQDAQPAVLLTQEHLLNDIGPVGGEAVCLDTQWPAIEEATPRKAGSGTSAEVFGSSAATVAPHNLAYVIYTSGSTGKPKGVQIPHQAAVNFLQSMQREPGLAAEDHLLAVTTLSFDIALLELLLPLICGARVTIASRETAVDGARLQQLLASAAITVMQATPATWRMLLEAGWAGKDDLKILCGGEALPPDLARQLVSRCASLWNMYGPTETTVWSTLCAIPQEAGIYRGLPRSSALRRHFVGTSTETISIGRPIANTQIYILDKNMQPVPTGVVGDLYIAGDGLARGYLNRPKLTAERFVANPFAGKAEVGREPRHFAGTSEAKMYKTGDRARYMADGNILFLGRDDFQVKIRGYRIELGDIETAVGQHPAVAQNFCVAGGESLAERRLVSYIVPHAGETLPAAAELRAFLRAKLPDYMIPAAIIPLEALPLLPNGKIDRNALAGAFDTSSAADGHMLTAAYVPPRNELEAQVAELSASVLNLEKISIHDSFFDLGGNSLLATRLVFQMRELFEVQIPLRQLFMQPTVAGLSAAIEAARQNGHLAKVPETPAKVPETLANGNGHVRDAQSLLGRMTLGELQAEVRLDPAIRAAGLPPARATSLQHVLLTGATGFVGAFLLRDLLRETEATIHCLVRAPDRQVGLNRLQKNMVTYGLWDETFITRLAPVPGDLGRPRFGLSDEQFQTLARQIDMIVHNGALVNFIYSYHEHKASNVLGTEEVLRLATQEKLKGVHFVSTLSVFHTGKDDHGTVFGEDADLDEVGVPFGGYAQSKWVGEKLLLLAAERGVPVAIYRPGLVAGDSRSGVWNTADMMSTMARACIALGAVPELDVDVDIVPVDYVSKALVTLALGSPAGRIFNLSNPQTMPYDELLSLVNAAGFRLRSLPFERWRGLLVDMVQGLSGEGTATESSPLMNPFLPLLEEITADQVFMPTFDHSHTLQGLAGTGVTCPPVGPELLQTYLGFFQSTGFVAK
jgi:amino acid adenylation domain-containing protein/thioester reductase-like protein